MRSIADVVDHAIFLIGIICVVLDVLAVIFDRIEIRIACRPELDQALRLVHAIFRVHVRRIVLSVHRDDRAVLHEQRQLPDRRVEVVQRLSAAVLFAGEVIDPDLIFSARQIDAVTYIIAHLIDRRIFIYRRNEQVLAPHVLIHGSCCICCRFFRILQQHRAHHRQALIAIACIDVRCRIRVRVRIRHHLCLQLQIHAADASVWISVNIRPLGIAAPAIHVEHLRRKALPLIITGRDDRRTAMDTIHVTADVRVSAHRLSDECRNMETDVLPVSARLVSGPYRIVTL